MKRVWEVLHPYREVVDGSVTEDSFVVTVGGVWERLELGRSVEVAPRYLDPEGFCRRTHFTEALRSIIQNVIRRLNGESVQSTYHLRVGMGGGKSHTLLLLYYLARNRDKVAPFLRQAGISHSIPKARVVVLDGMRVSPHFGFTYPDGTKVNTLWGLLLKQLGVYEAYRDLDSWKEAPTIPVLREVLSPEPTLILVDELTPYVAQVGDREDRIQAFLQALTAAVKETKGCALVVTTPIGVYEEAYRLIAPILDRYSKPMVLASGAEYKEIRRRTIFQDDFRALQESIARLAQEYGSYYATHLPNYAARAEETIPDNYPFHPFVDRTLLKLKNSEAFQEVRDELRFLAGLVYSVYRARPPDAYLITVGHAELTDQYVRAGTIAKLQNPILVNRVDDDLTRVKGTFEAELRQAGMRVLTTIVLNSLAAETPLQLGVTEEEVIYALLTPDLHPALLKKALAECGKKLWFVNLTDGRWVFGSPNLIKLIDDYIHKVERDRSLRGRWWDIIREELTRWKTSTYKYYLKDAKEKVKPLFEEGNIYIWPVKSEEIPDDRCIKLIFLDYHLPLASVIPEEYLSQDERATSIETRLASSHEEAVQAAKEFSENYGRSSRKYKNTVFLLVADKTLVEKNGPIKYAKQLLALNEMLKDREQLKPLIGDTGLTSIEQMREICIRDLQPSCVTVYRYLLYPSRDGLAAIELGEERRNLQGFLTMVESKLKTQAQKIIDVIDAESLLTRYWPHERPRLEVQELIDGFYRRPELELVSEEAAIERAIRSAIREGKLVYTYGHETYYKREPPKLEGSGVLLRDFKLITLHFEAVDEHDKPLNVPITIDNKSIMKTPFSLPDLSESTHTLVPEIPTDMVFDGWSDGIKEPMRTLTWDSERTLKLLLKSKGPPPPTPEVSLTLEAFEISKNQPLHVNLWLDGLQYRTPYRGKVAKDSTHEIRLERPPDLMFIGWSDQVDSLERKVVCDIDTALVAKFKPIEGMELWEGSVKLSEAYDHFKQVMDRDVNQLRLVIKMDYTTYMKYSGSIGMLLRGSHEVTFTGAGGTKMGLKQFTVQAKGGSDKVEVMKSSLTQLRGYLETVEVTLNIRLEDHKPLREVVSEDALEALRSAEGLLEYRAQLRGTGLKEDRPKRTLEDLLESFKKEA